MGVEDCEFLLKCYYLKCGDIDCNRDGQHDRANVGGNVPFGQSANSHAGSPPGKRRGVEAKRHDQ